MKHRALIEQHMREDGFEPRTDYQVALYSTIGPKWYAKLVEVGFNMAIAEKETNTEAKHGDYQGDMMHAQSLCEKIAYENCCCGNFNPNWLRGFLEKLSVEECKEDILQNRAYRRLEETCRDDRYAVALSDED